MSIHRRHRRLALVSLALMSCSSPRPPAASTYAAAAAPSTPLVLDAESGERRVRRPGNVRVGSLNTPFIIKVDRRNGGAPDFVMGTEDIAPGQAIAPHRHLVADEIVFIHRGSGV